MQITESEYLGACDAYEGYCTECDDITTGCVEPDAEGYECDVCGDAAVMGTEQALLCGLIEVS